MCIVTFGQEELWGFSKSENDESADEDEERYAAQSDHGVSPRRSVELMNKDD